MVVLIQSLHFAPAIHSSQNLKPYRRRNSASSHPPLLLRFRTSRRQKSQYLKFLGIEPAAAATVETIDHILLLVDYLKNKGLSDTDFPRLSYLCPQIFSSSSSVTAARDLDSLFAFLASDVNASPEQSRLLITTCPELLRRNVDLSLRPTVEFLKEIGVRNLNSPTTINAHLINTPMERLVDKVRFLEYLGLSFEESALVCRRFPAIFGYSLEYNLKPKVEYLVGEMERPVAEMVKFPQYLGFSLEKRIVPRHLHLMSRKKKRIPLPKMLMYSDAKFYEIWK